MEYLGDGINRVWGHIARWVESSQDAPNSSVADWENEGGALPPTKKIREYYCIVMLHDTKTGEISRLQIIAGADDFSTMPPAKNEELPFITFMAGPDYSRGGPEADKTAVVIATGDSAVTTTLVDAPAL